jgi:hypothetical protein
VKRHEIRRFVACAWLAAAISACASAPSTPPPSPGPSLAATPQPSPSAGAASLEPLDGLAASPSARPTPGALTNTYTDPSGFEIRYGQQYSDDALTLVSPGLGIVTVVGTCSFDFCPLTAIVSGGTIDEGPVVAFDPPRRIAGGTLDELEAAWVGVFGPLSRTPRSITVDGEIGRLLQSGDAAAAILVIHRDHAYSFVAQPFLGYGPNTEFLNTVVANVTFVEPS